MRKLIFILILTMLLCGSVEGATKIGLDRLNWSQSIDGIKFSGTAPASTTGKLYVESGGLMFDGQTVGGGQFNILAYGATPDDFTDDASAIQDAYDAAYAVYDATGRHQVVYWPPGEYNGNTSQAALGGTTIIIENRPGVITQGAGAGVSIFRAKDNYRDASHGVYLLWNENEYLPGLQIRDITFEYGNNTVHAGESNYTGVGATWCDNIIIENVECLNVSGYWALYFGGAAGKTCSNALVSGVRVYNSEGSSVADDDTYDHTSVRFNMENVIFRDSILENEVMPSNAAGFEFHGNDSIASNIIVKNYTTGTHLGADQTSACTASGQQVLDCYMEVVHGIVLWSQPSGADLVDFRASGNKIVLQPHATSVRSRGLGTGTVTGTISNVTFTNNEVLNVNESASYPSSGVYICDIENLVVRNNIFKNVTNAFRVDNTALIGVYDVSQNFVDRWGIGASNGQHTAGMYFDLQLSADGGKLVCDRNTMIGYGYPYYGILAYCPNLVDISIRDNDIQGCAVVDITDITPGAWITDEKVYIEHHSRDKYPLGAGWAITAADGSTWQAGGNGTLYRMDTTWRKVSWTYA